MIFQVLLVLGELLYVWVFALISSFASVNFTNFVITNNSQQKHILNTPHLRFHEKQIHMMQFQQCIIVHVVPSQIAVMHLRHICASHTRRPRSSLEPLCSPSTTPYPSKYLGVQVDLFKSNPAASTDPVIIHLLSPRVTDLGLKLPKNIILTLSHIAMIL